MPPSAKRTVQQNKARSPIYRLRLRNSYTRINITAALILLVAIIGIEFNPELFSSWVRNFEIFRLSVYILTVVHCVFIILNEFVSGDKLYIYVVLNTWNTFHIVLVYLTGGIASPFIFMMAFPVAVSALYLDFTHSKYLGILYTAVLALMILMDPQYLTDTGALVRHFFQTAAFGLLIYYIYNVVKETMLQREQKEQVQRDILQMAEISNVKDNFLTTMSHQLRTPLTGVRWALTNIAENTEGGGERYQRIQEAKEKVNESIGIVDEILNTAEASGAGIDLDREQINLHDMVVDIVDELDYLTVENDVATYLDIASPCEIFGDAEMIRGAVTNVIDNAIRYSPEGEVHVTLECTKDTATLIVEDTGIGISKETREHIFDRFYRGGEAVSIDPNQSGVGMYVTHNIVSMHDGSIEVDSEEGEGTTITITLPRGDTPEESAEK